ncbi:RNase H-like domain found in reverse transcriptase [Popillia japonica]|uniref:RNA-directed DNA polymerase n=1 Tax=Popillia japonica TaxID=7064 RepID=A0AAW1IY69_POPJA
MNVNETKQEVLIELRSKSLCEAIFPLRLNSVEELLHFLHEYQTIETKRSEGVYDNTRNDPRRRLHAISDTKTKDKDGSRGEEESAQVVHNEHIDPKCYNCGFEFFKLPFGFCNSPSIFVWFVAELFKDLINESFLRSELMYLEYVISEKCIQSNPVNAVSNFPIPENVKQLHSFVGLASYFPKFIKDFAVTAKPVYDLLRKNAKFEFGKSQLEAMEALKEQLFTHRMPQRSCMTRRHPVSYFTKRTTNTESKYHSYELECLAIVYALKRFNVYLRGIKFKIITDCHSIKNVSQ